MTIEFRIDYFRITVHKTIDDCLNLYQECFEFTLGKLIDLEHGAIGFKNTLGGLLGFQLKHNPITGREYCTFEFPGQACGSIAPEQFIDFYNLTKIRDYRTNVTRIDFAFDNVPFTPDIFRNAVINDANKMGNEKHVMRSLTERASLSWMSKPLEFREDKSGRGQDTCCFGHRTSQRFLRIYNKRGPCRLELELKEERANAVAGDLFNKNVELYWFDIAIAHLKDFIDIDLPWWKEFTNNKDRAYMKLKYAKEVSLEKSERWLLEQVSPSLSAVLECTNGEFMLEIDKEGRKRMYKRYAPLLSVSKQNHERRI
jgi:DNA relaxase NicK